MKHRFAKLKILIHRTISNARQTNAARQAHLLSRKSRHMDVAYLQKLGQVIRNAHRMLRDRGYLVTMADIEDPMDISAKAYKKALEMKKSLGEALCETFKPVQHSGTKALDLWVLDRNYDFAKNRDRMISTDQIKSVLQKTNPDHLSVIVCPNKLSPLAKKEPLQQGIELFLFDELLIDLPRHELVVPHTIISEDQVRKYLGKTLCPTDLPVLLSNDPIAKWFAFSKGSIVQLDHPVMPSWRIVV